MDKNIKDHINHLLGTRIKKIVPLSGGDISKAYLLQTETERFFCKVNLGSSAQSMFLAEMDGLQSISKTKTIKAPQVFFCKPLEKGGCLVMDYIEPKRPSSRDMELLGHQLAELHKTTAMDFGWDNDNFIGSLPQSNKKHGEWVSFYVEERLLPQLHMAENKKLLSGDEIPTQERMHDVIKKYCPETKPSFLHGDLWNGNYLIANDGTPYLIDPAVYYGHNEIDIAMSRLFGGFDTAFYNAYQELFPSAPLENERTAIYQLYYLLVHLNLFGSSYYGSVSRILKHYF